MELRTRQVCARIREARTGAGLTLQQMSDLLEVHVRSYQDYERDVIPYRHIGRIAEATQTSVRWLLSGVDELQLLQKMGEALTQLEQGMESVLQQLDENARVLALLRERQERIEASLLPTEDRNKSRAMTAPRKRR